MEMFTIILLLSYILFLIIGDAILLVRWRKCFNMKECHNQDCSFKCQKYSDEFTREDYQSIQQLISDLE